MPEDQIMETSREILAVFRRIPVSKLDRLLALTVAMGTVMNDVLSDAPDGDIGLRVGRRTLHAFPEAIERFLDIWQPGELKTAIGILFDTLGPKILRDIRNNPGLRGSLHRG